MSKMIRTIYFCTKKQKKKVEKLARKNKVTQSEIIRRMIDAYE
jgi:general stress protein 26